MFAIGLAETAQSKNGDFASGELILADHDHWPPLYNH
jgi:hypothetical protein